LPDIYGSDQLNIGSDTNSWITGNSNFNIGLGTANPTSKLWVDGDGYFTGILTANRIFSSQYGEFVGGSISGTNLVGTSLSISGISTLGVTSTTNLTSQQLNVSGITTVRFITASNIYSAGVVTATTFYGTFSGNASSATYATNAGIATYATIAGYSTSSGIATYATSSGIATYATIAGYSTSSGISTNVIGGIASVTQLYVSSGITTVGFITASSAYVSGIVTATTFVGALTGTATSTTNIPNLTGVITSNNTTTSLGSFSSSNLATALSDKTGSGVAVFATSPTLVTPALGAATATSIVVGSGVTINASGINAASGIITASQLSTGASGTGININTNTISGPATLTIDPAAVGDNTGAVRIKGDLYVDGTQFIVNSTTIELADFNVGIATTVGTNALLDGAGIGIGSIGIRKTLTWSNSSTALKSSEDFDVASGKVYRVNGTSVLSNDTLGSGVVNSSLTSVGTLGQLNVTGVSTLGITSATNLTSQQLNVSGITTLGITSTTNLTSQQLNVSGISTLGVTSTTNLTSQQLNVSGITTLGVTSTTNLTSQQLNVSGISTLGVTSTTNLTSQQLNVSGISTLGITSTTNLTSQQLNVSGISTLGVTSTTNLTSQQLNVSGITTLQSTTLIGGGTSTGTSGQVLQVSGINSSVYIGGSVGIGTTNPTSKLWVDGSGYFTGILTANRIFSSQYGEFVGGSISGTAIVGTSLSVSGLSTFTNGPVLIGSATSTGTASQRLQVTGGAYVSSNVGVAVTAPSFAVDVSGDARVQSTGKMRFGGTAGSTNFYIQYNSTTNSLDFVAG